MRPNRKMIQMTKRKNKLFKACSDAGAQAVLVSAPPSIRYFTGFTGSNGLFLMAGSKDLFITDFRYSEQVREEVDDCEFIITPIPPIKYLVENKLIPKDTKLAIEDKRMSYDEYRTLISLFPQKNLYPASEIISGLRSVKDSREIAKLRQAASITDSVFTYIRGIIKPGITERDIAAEIAFQIRKQGGEKEGFDTIAAFGPRSALPHAKTGSNKLVENELIVLDFGAVYEGYHADITRTLLIGEPGRRQMEIYSAVLEAQKAAIKKARAGISGAGLDRIARDIIKDRGFDEFFGHGLGHGLGLEIHEPPRLSAQNKARLKKGTVVTIEPGIYIPGLGGVRIEDDVVIENGQCMVLTESPKELVLAA